MRVVSSLTWLLAFGSLLATLAPSSIAYAEEEPVPVAKLLADMKHKEEPVRRKAAEHAATVHDAKLVAPLAKLLKDDSADVRAAAVDALRQRIDRADQKRAAQALLARVPRKDGLTDRAERLAVLKALHDLARPETVRPLLDAIEVTTDLDEVEARLIAVGNVPHADAIERLITFLAKGRGDRSRHRALAVKALRYATGVNYSRDPDAWRAWWRKAQRTFDLEQRKRDREAAARAAAEKKAERERKKEEKRRRRQERNNGGEGRPPQSD